jgi:signal transduction histidine kinase
MAPAIGMDDAVDGQATKNRRAISQNDFNRILLAVLGAGLVVLAVLGGCVVWLAVKTSEYNDWVDHGYVAEQHIVAFADAVDRAESARRGYLLAPVAPLLSAYQAARNDVTVRLYALAVATEDNPVQRANIARMKPLLAWKTKINDDSVALVRAGRREEAMRAFPVEQTMEPLIGVGRVTRDMFLEERRLFDIRLKQQRDSIRLLVGIGLAAALLLAALSFISMLVMRRFADGLTRAQGQLRALNQSLERRVDERTIDLTRANQEIQRFAYIVSHDLRSPLVNVMGFTSELEEAMKPLRGLVHAVEAEDAQGRLTKPAKQAIDLDIPEAIDFIRSSTRKMDSLISAILKLSREGRRVLQPERLPMDLVVETLLGTVNHRVHALGGEAVIEGPLPDIVSDRFAIEQVFGNLIDNAVKYHCARRPLRIVVRGAEEDGRVIYEVADNGRGVDPKDHDRIFDLFRRSGAQTQPGEGIGLAHVRALMHRLGGVISVSSALDQGAVFRLSLPRVLASAEGISA